MNAQDYSDIIELCDKATEMLDDYFSNKGYMNLSLAKEISLNFMDGSKVRNDILDTIPVSFKSKFAASVIRIYQTYSYSEPPRRNNETNALYASILCIKETIEYLIKTTNEKDKKNLKVFYSWQLSTSGKYNKYFIRDCLLSAVKDLNQSIPIEDRDQIKNIEVDSDTQGTAGSPPIFTTILNKIDTSTLFIADVSTSSKKTCNSNVMLELGYAIKTVGFDNILMIFNTALGSIDDLPFDLRSLRISNYSYKEGDDKKAASKHLTSLLKTSISAALK